MLINLYFGILFILFYSLYYIMFYILVYGIYNVFIKFFFVWYGSRNYNKWYWGLLIDIYC